jgi:hypothetical protein
MDDDGKDWWQEESKSEKVEKYKSVPVVQVPVVVGVQDTDTVCTHDTW